MSKFTLKPWQEKMVYDLTQLDMQKTLGGIKRGEMMIMSSGRQVGKSMLNQTLRQMWAKFHQERPIEDLILDESKWHGARYYRVEPVGGNWATMEAWCTETFGDAAEVWDLKSTGEQFIWPEAGRWYKNDRKFWFRNERDRTMFIMRWSR